MIQPLDPAWKDLLQAAAWSGTAAGAIVAAWKFWSELRESRLQRERELRWRQAEAGKSLNDEMQTDPLAWPALQMLDSDRRKFELPDGQSVEVTHADLSRALDPRSTADDDKSIYIRDCFDTLFYFLAMLEHHISNTLVQPEDVAYPIEYYVPLMAELHAEISGYLSLYNLRRTRRFLERYDAWKRGVSST